MGPKRRGIIKMYIALFITFPPEFTNEEVIVRIEKRKLLQVLPFSIGMLRLFPQGPLSYTLYIGTLDGVI